MFDNDIEECHATFKASESMSPTDRVRLYIKTLLPDAPSAHWLLYLELWPMAARDDDYANLVHNQSLQWINILEEIIGSGINRESKSQSKGNYICSLQLSFLEKNWHYAIPLVIECFVNHSEPFYHSKCMT